MNIFFPIVAYSSPSVIDARVAALKSIWHLPLDSS